MGWELAASLSAMVARERGGFGALRSWFGQTPRTSEEQRPFAIAQMAGYSIEPSSPAFVVLDADEAVRALTFFATDSMVMSQGREPPKERLVTEFRRGVEQLGPAARFYSNGPWGDPARSGSFWRPLSNATFDGGVIGLNDQVAFIVWVEEED